VVRRELSDGRTVVVPLNANHVRAAAAALHQADALARGAFADAVALLGGVGPAGASGAIAGM
jgi:hypothetical protein